MSRGRAFEIHMQNIQDHLLNPRDVMSDSSSNLAPESNTEADCNEEIEATISFSAAGRPEPLWKAYRNWVVLMIVQFEVTSTLRQFIRSADYDHQPITVTILLGATVSSEILKLDDLFDSDFLPGNHQVNIKLGVFVKKALSAIEQQYDHSVAASTFWNDNLPLADSPLATRKYFTLVLLGHMSAMLDADPSKRYVQLVQSIKNLVADWLFHPSIIASEGKSAKTDTPLPNLIVDISKKLQEIVNLLCQDLDEYGPVPYLKLNFDGTLHCETCLAALLDPLTRQRLAGNPDFKNVMDATAVGYSCDLFLVIKPSFVVMIGLWARTWSIKTFLPNVSLFPFPVVARRSLHHAKLSQFDYSLHPTSMDFGRHCG